MSIRHQVGNILIAIGTVAALLSLYQSQEAILERIPILNLLYIGGVVISLPFIVVALFLVARSFLFMGEGHGRLGAYANPLALSYITSWFVYLFTLNSEGLTLIPYLVFVILSSLLYWIGKKSFTAVDRTVMVLGLIFAVLYFPLLILATNIFVE